jgi:hypothetical protein
MRVCVALYFVFWKRNEKGNNDNDNNNNNMIHMVLTPCSVLFNTIKFCTVSEQRIYMFRMTPNK